MDHGANVQSREDSKQEGRFTHYQCYVGVSLGNDSVCAVFESVTTFLLKKFSYCYHCFCLTIGLRTLSQLA